MTWQPEMMMMMMMMDQQSSTPRSPTVSSAPNLPHFGIDFMGSGTLGVSFYYAELLFYFGGISWGPDTRNFYQKPALFYGSTPLLRASLDTVLSFKKTETQIGFYLLVSLVDDEAAAATTHPHDDNTHSCDTTQHHRRVEHGARGWMTAGAAWETFRCEGANCALRR